MRNSRILRTLGVALLMAALGAAFAPRALGQVSFGIKGGMISAKLTGDNMDSDWRNGFTGGGFVNYRFGELFVIQPEILFAQKGANVNEFEGEVFDGKLRLNYIEVPLFAKLLLPVANQPLLRPFLMAGPSIAFKTYCEAEGTLDGVSLVTECDDPDIGAYVKDTDWSLVFGGGFGVPIRNFALVIDARYQFGLGTIDDTADPDDIKNRSFTVMAGFSIPVNRPIVAALR